MTKAEILLTIKQMTGVSKRDVGLVLDMFACIVKSADRVRWPKFGVFKKRNKLERIARNPKTGEKVMVPAKEILTFKASN